MSKKTRHKNLAQAAQKRQENRERHQRKKRRMVQAAVFGVVFVALGFLFFPILFGGDDAASSGSSDVTFPRDAPFPMTINPNSAYTATMKTSKGTIKFDLYAQQSPVTVNNFVNLADAGYYDGQVFHRISNDIDIIQGGDPECAKSSTEACGSGGPGYSIPDELSSGLKMEVGSLAMANAGANTGGSQFFIVTGEKGLQLPPNYTIFGKVSDGLDKAQAIQDVPATPDEKPTERIDIESVTIDGPPRSDPNAPPPSPGGKQT